MMNNTIETTGADHWCARCGGYFTEDLVTDVEVEDDRGNSLGEHPECYECLGYTLDEWAEENA